MPKEGSGHNWVSHDFWWVDEERGACGGVLTRRVLKQLARKNKQESPRR